MKFFNLFYFIVLGIGISLFVLLRFNSHEQLSFYGFSESNETEINYNYPVVVKTISVTPGQAVNKGQELLHLVRQSTKEILADQNFKIEELQAKKEAWLIKKNSELMNLHQKLNADTTEINALLITFKNELEYKVNLSDGLKSISLDKPSYKPLREKIVNLNLEKENVIKNINIEIDGVRQQIAQGKDPFNAEISRLKAEQLFEEEQKTQDIIVTAPSDGLIGTISCKEEEHIPSYNTLLSFYEPHSGLIKGYVHEDLTLKVKIGDSFIVSSLKDDTKAYSAQVVGLGSRIVEIPSRLRKIPDLKSYGREVLLEITKENIFLQKEKVSIHVAPVQ